MNGNTNAQIEEFIELQAEIVMLSIMEVDDWVPVDLVYQDLYMVSCM